MPTWSWLTLQTPPQVTWGNFGYPREAGNTSVCFNLYYFIFSLLLDPRAKLLSNLYEDIVRAVKKEDLLHVSMLLKQFKALHRAFQLCVGLAEDGCMLVDIYSIIVTILYTMRLQLDAHDNIYIKHKYGKETLCHFAILDESNLVGERQACLLDAIALAHASTTN